MCSLRFPRGQRTQQSALTTGPFSANGLHFHLRKFPLVTPGGIEPQALWILTKSVLSLALYQLDHMATGKIFLGEGTWYPACCNLVVGFPSVTGPACSSLSWFGFGFKLRLSTIALQIRYLTGGPFSKWKFEISEISMIHAKIKMCSTRIEPGPEYTTVWLDFPANKIPNRWHFLKVKVGKLEEAKK